MLADFQICISVPLILSKFVHSINIVGTLYLMSRNVDFRTSILQLSYYKNNFQPEKFSFDICQSRTFKHITWRMVFIKHKSAKPDIFFNPIFIPCLLVSKFFRVQVFQGPGSLGSRFFRVQVFQASGFSGSESRVRVKVLEVAFTRWNVTSYSAFNKDNPTPFNLSKDKFESLCKLKNREQPRYSKGRQGQHFCHS